VTFKVRALARIIREGTNHPPSGLRLRPALAGLRSGLARVSLEPFDKLTVPSLSRDKVREHRVETRPSARSALAGGYERRQSLRE
jgi:hypothetical protein